MIVYSDREEDEEEKMKKMTMGGVLQGDRKKETCMGSTETRESTNAACFHWACRSPMKSFEGERIVQQLR